MIGETKNGIFVTNTGDLQSKYNNKITKGLVSAKITNPERTISTEVEHF